jgi:hypothetical protein
MEVGESHCRFHSLSDISVYTLAAENFQIMVIDEYWPFGGMLPFPTWRMMHLQDYKVSKLRIPQYEDILSGSIRSSEFLEAIVEVLHRNTP